MAWFEPNATFTPDAKWIVFRSNLHGGRHVCAVEVAKAEMGKQPAADGADQEDAVPVSHTD